MRVMLIIAMKLFTDDVDTSEPAVPDLAREEMSRGVKIFCMQISSTLTILEEGTPLPN